MIGGHAAFNPEPLAPFVDVVCAGDGEEFVLEVDELVKVGRAQGWSRDELLAAHRRRSRARTSPSWYEPEYLAPRARPCAGTFPRHEGVPYRVPKRTVSDLDQWPYPKRTIVPLTETCTSVTRLRSSAGAPAGAASARPG